MAGMKDYRRMSREEFRKECEREDANDRFMGIVLVCWGILSIVVSMGGHPFCFAIGAMLILLGRDLIRSDNQ